MITYLQDQGCHNYNYVCSTLYRSRTYYGYLQVRHKCFISWLLKSILLNRRLNCLCYIYRVVYVVWEGTWELQQRAAPIYVVRGQRLVAYWLNPYLVLWNHAHYRHPDRMMPGSAMIFNSTLSSSIIIYYVYVLYTLHSYVYRSLKPWTTEFDEYIFKYTLLYYIIMLSTASDLAWPDEKGTRFWQYLWVQRKTFIKWYYISYIYIFAIFRYFICLLVYKGVIYVLPYK